jgi:hypothetical protein
MRPMQKAPVCVKPAQKGGGGGERESQREKGGGGGQREKERERERDREKETERNSSLSGLRRHGEIAGESGGRGASEQRFEEGKMHKGRSIENKELRLAPKLGGKPCMGDMSDAINWSGSTG